MSDEVVTNSPFEGYNTVEAWVRHVEASPVGTPGCLRAGGGPPPPRYQNGFWVQGPSYYGTGLYAWVPDEIAARDNTGKYRAGQNSPGSGVP